MKTLFMHFILSCIIYTALSVTSLAFSAFGNPAAYKKYNWQAPKGYHIAVFKTPIVEDSSENPKFVSCYKPPDEPRLGIIPNPYDCTTFFLCELKPIENSSGEYEPMPVLMECASGHNGPTFFNLRTCRCEQDDDVECFDYTCDDHMRGFWNCSTKWDGTGF